MKRNTIKEMHEILDAIEQGKKVQFRRVDGSNEWEDYALDTPDFFTHCYRIKPEEPKKKWRSFASTGELFTANVGCKIIFLKDKSRDRMRLITGYNDEIVEIDGTTYNMRGLFELFTFADGTPCGVEEDA